MEYKLVLKKEINPKKDNFNTKEEFTEIEQQQLVKSIGMMYELTFDFTIEELFDKNFDPEDDDIEVMENSRQSKVEYWDIYSDDKVVQQMVIFGEQNGYLFETDTLNMVIESGLLGDSYFEAENEEQKELCKALAIAREEAIKTFPQSRLAELDFFVMDE